MVTVVLIVKSVNDAPVAANANASFVLQQDGRIIIDLRSLVRDVERDALIITAGSAANGTLTKNADGTYTYEARKGYVGNDSFTYSVSDGKLSATGSVSLTVQPAAAQASAATVNRSASVVIASGASGASGAPAAAVAPEIRYAVINTAAAQASSNGGGIVVNWQSGSSSAAALGVSLPEQGQSWLGQRLATAKNDENEDLAAKTGLAVKL